MNEALIIAKVAAKDSSAFQYLYKEYFGMICHFITNNSGNEADAEDVFQDTLVLFYEKTLAADFQLHCSVKTFLYAISRNIWLKRLRNKQLNLAISDNEPFTDVETDEEADLHNGYLAKATQALAALGDKCRELLIHFFYYKKNMVQIAAEMNYANADTAKNQKYKCLQQLKKMTGNE